MIDSVHISLERLEYRCAVEIHWMRKSNVCKGDSSSERCGVGG